MNRFIRQLPGKVKQSREWLNQAQRWPLILTISIVWGVTIWQVYRTEFLAGFWGITNDEIAVVTIERDDSNSSDTSTETIIIQDPSKSFWDGLQLLGVPLVLAILGAWFQKSQQEQAERTAKEQREQDADETREEVLQLYFDRISALLVDKNLMAIAAKESTEFLLNDSLKTIEAKEKRTPEEQSLLEAALNIIRNRSVDRKLEQLTPEQQELLDAALDVIRARTLSILRRFENDIDRKSSIIRFLAEAEIVSKLKLDLNGANLEGANLNGANLNGAKLSRAILGGAKLSRAILNRANLNGTKLEGAILKWANLEEAHLSGAYLNGAYLEGAILSGANLKLVNLEGANLERAYLRGAILKWANLERAILNGAYLYGVNLEGANLKSIYFNDETIWPAKEKFAKAQNVPIKLQNQLGLIPEPPQKSPTAQQSLKPPQ